MFGKRKIKKMLNEYSNNSYNILIQGLQGKEILNFDDFKKAKVENMERALKIIEDIKTNKNKLIPFDSELLKFRNQIDYVSSKIYKKTDYKAEFIRTISEVKYTLNEEAFHLCKIQFHFGFDTEQVKAIIFKDDLKDLNEGNQVLVGISMAYRKSYFQIKKGNFPEHYKNKTFNNKIMEEKFAIKKKLRQTFQESVMKALDSLDEKPLKGSPRGDFIELMIHRQAEKYKEVLANMKDETGLTDEDIKETIYMAKMNIKNELFPDMNDNKDRLDVEGVYQKIIQLKDDIYDFDTSEDLEPFQDELHKSNGMNYEKEKNEEKEFIELLRNGPDSPGEVTRNFTQIYFDDFYKGEDNLLYVESFLREINQDLIDADVGMDHNFLQNLAIDYSDSLPILFFSFIAFANFKTYEDHIGFIKNSPLTYKIVVEEFNKVCPENQRFAELDYEQTAFAISQYIRKNL